MLLLFNLASWLAHHCAGKRIVPLLLVLLCLSLSACSSASGESAVRSAVATAQPAPTDAATLRARAITAVVPTPQPQPGDSAATLSIMANATNPCEATTMSDTPARSTKPVPDDWVSYDAKDNTITLNDGADLNLAAVGRALDQPDLLRELAPGDWLLSANLQIAKGATLQIGGPAMQRLKLRSDTGGFVWIKARGGRLTFSGVCVTSWNAAQRSYDDELDDGRSFVLARDGAQMDIRDSELSYLGYDANESYGVAWRLEGTSGEAVNSRFGYNYYGMYSYEASDLVIRGNEVHHSARYGIDPHTRSNNLLIENNVAHDNGKHGIILAEECSNSIIRNNTSYNNDLHGIVLYQRSNNNVVEGNVVYGNELEGIDINDSSQNIVRNNIVYNNGKAGIGVGQGSQDNRVVGNRVYDNREDGIALYSGASGTVIEDNTATNNARYGIYVKSAGNTVADDNTVTGNRAGEVEGQ